MTEFFFSAKSGLLYVKQKGVDGIISTRGNIIKVAREAGLFTVQRFFIVDSQSVSTTLEGIKASKSEVRDAIYNGAVAVSTSKRELWGKEKS